MSTLHHNLTCPRCAGDATTTYVAAPDGGFLYTCFRGYAHDGEGLVHWTADPTKKVAVPATGYTTEGVTADLAEPLLSIITALPRRWIEHGVIEYQLRLDHPDLFARHVADRGHVLTHATQATASSVRFAAGLLRLERMGHVRHKLGPATGAWSYNAEVGYWALADVALGPDDLTWEARAAELGRAPAWEKEDYAEVEAMAAAAQAIPSIPDS